MKTRSIIFSSDMIRALLAGHKSQTRRIVTPQHITKFKMTVESPYLQAAMGNPFGLPGDVLWVKETWRTAPLFDDIKPSLLRLDIPVEYKADINSADLQGYSTKWRTPLFMPKAISRLHLSLKNVRVEKLHDCSESDAKAEGIALLHGFSSGYVDGYRQTWESIHGHASWGINPLVWVIEFEIIKLRIGSNLSNSL